MTPPADLPTYTGPTGRSSSLASMLVASADSVAAAVVLLVSAVRIRWSPSDDEVAGKTKAASAPTANQRDINCDDREDGRTTAALASQAAPATALAPTNAVTSTVQRCCGELTEREITALFGQWARELAPFAPVLSPYWNEARADASAAVAGITGEANRYVSIEFEFALRFIRRSGSYIADEVGLGPCSDLDAVDGLCRGRLVGAPVNDEARRSNHSQRCEGGRSASGRWQPAKRCGLFGNSQPGLRRPRLATAFGEVVAVALCEACGRSTVGLGESRQNPPRPTGCAVGTGTPGGPLKSRGHVNGDGSSNYPSDPRTVGSQATIRYSMQTPGPHPELSLSVDLYVWQPTVGSAIITTDSVGLAERRGAEALHILSVHGRGGNDVLDPGRLRSLIDPAHSARAAVVAATSRSSIRTSGTQISALSLSGASKWFTIAKGSARPCQRFQSVSVSSTRLRWNGPNSELGRTFHGQPSPHPTALRCRWYIGRLPGWFAVLRGLLHECVRDAVATRVPGWPIINPHHRWHFVRIPVPLGSRAR